MRRLVLSILAVAATTTLGLACQGGGAAAGADGDLRVHAGVTVAPPATTEDAYALALDVTLAKVAPIEHPGLHNVYALSDRIWSGSEPHGAAAFEQLAALGVKTILSVDGKIPDAERAAANGMRYVHVPIRYSGIARAEMLRIAKTFRELPGPFYVHCFHGRHRGPAGAAVGRLVLDGAARAQAVAEMRQWCGTSHKYAGLYRVVARGDIPSAAETAALAFDFPAAAPLKGLRHAMITAPRVYDNLVALAARDFVADPAHPDLDARNEAAKLHELFSQSERLDEVRQAKADLRGWLAQSAAASGALRAAVDAIAPNGATDGAADGAPNGMDAVTRAKAHLDTVTGLCASCHRVYRNR